MSSVLCNQHRVLFRIVDQTRGHRVCLPTAQHAFAAPRDRDNLDRRCCSATHLLKAATLLFPTSFETTNIVPLGAAVGDETTGSPAVEIGDVHSVKPDDVVELREMQRRSPE
eukprot:TRINITY_DN13686_c0_g1_i1.p1 TRINITY_DN13686_c0_g1~~TRINITY_DN13686_c0_g1_i1.p1  ORF type:complete len:112 (-),score=5.41 TRINITY_DN13686_c0_g1_i1:557-892(-)